MNILTIVQDYGLSPKKHSTSNGGEYCSPCPRCGGDDRFIIQPNHKGGRYFCRQKDSCGTSGDAIQFLIDFTGKSFKEAADYVGKQLEDRPFTRRRHSHPIKVEDSGPFMEVSEKLIPEERWRQQASAAVGAAHEILLENEERLKWLAARGIDMDAVKFFKLGWIENPKFYSLKKWGLPEELNEKQNAKKLWIPKGYLIPQWNLEGRLTMLQVRMDELLPNNKMRYYPVKGSTVTPMIIPPEPSLPPERTAWLPVESRLDAIMVASHAGDILGTMAQGSNSANPCAEGIKLLDASPLILYGMDYDEAGLSSFKKWRKRFKTTKLWPVPEGGDPGEYVQDHNGDIREWILAGLPPGLQITRKKTTSAASSDVPVQDLYQAPQPLYREIRTEDGRDIFVTNSRKTYEQLESEGKLTLSYKEVEKITAFKEDGGDPTILLNIKDIFGGRISERVELGE